MVMENTIISVLVDVIHFLENKTKLSKEKAVGIWHLDSSYLQNVYD